jgi:hypothetical protein
MAAVNDNQECQNDSLRDQASTSRSIQTEIAIVVSLDRRHYLSYVGISRSLLQFHGRGTIAPSVEASITAAFMSRGAAEWVQLR